MGYLKELLVRGRQGSGRYRKLICEENDEKGTNTVTRNTSRQRSFRKQRWVVKKMNGRLRGLKLRRLNYWNIKLMMVAGFSSSMIVLPRRVIAKIYAQIVISINKLENGSTVYPSVLLSSHWGFPVFSHSSSVFL